MTSLRGPGDKNFNAVSHKPTRAPIQSVPVSFGLWDTALKFLSPGPRNDVTDHLVVSRMAHQFPLTRVFVYQFFFSFPVFLFFFLLFFFFIRRLRQFVHPDDTEDKICSLIVFYVAPCGQFCTTQTYVSFL